MDTQGCAGDPESRKTFSVIDGCIRRPRSQLESSPARFDDGEYTNRTPSIGRMQGARPAQFSTCSLVGNGRYSDSGPSRWLLSAVRLRAAGRFNKEFSMGSDGSIEGYGLGIGGGSSD